MTPMLLVLAVGQWPRYAALPMILLSARVAPVRYLVAIFLRASVVRSFMSGPTARVNVLIAVQSSAWTASGMTVTLARVRTKLRLFWRKSQTNP